MGEESDLVDLEPAVGIGADAEAEGVGGDGAAHRELGAAMLKRVETELADEITVEQYPRMEGRQMVMMIAPKKH